MTAINSGDHGGANLEANRTNEDGAVIVGWLSEITVTERTKVPNFI